MRKRIFLLSAMLCICGCTQILGLEQDYVLREPIVVQFTDHGTPTTLPAGARVKRTFMKDDVAFIVVSGTTSRKELERAGTPE